MIKYKTGGRLGAGDKVKIMPYTEIEAMLEHRYNGLGKTYDNLRFVTEMVKHCGKLVTLVSCYRNNNRKGYVWNIEENSWVWHEDWFFPKIGNFLTDKDFEI